MLAFAQPLTAAATALVIACLELASDAVVEQYATPGVGRGLSPVGPVLHACPGTSHPERPPCKRSSPRRMSSRSIIGSCSAECLQGEMP